MVETIKARGKREKMLRNGGRGIKHDRRKEYEEVFI